MNVTARNTSKAFANRALAICFACVLITLVACAPTVDESSPDALAASLDEIRASLEAGERAEFDEAVDLLAEHGYLGDMESSEDTASYSPADRDLDRSLEGMNADEVIAEAEELRVRLEQEQKAAELAELGSLRKLEAEFTSARDELDQFTVEAATFRQDRTRFGQTQPVIEVRVANDTAHDVGQVLFYATLRQHEGSEVMLERSFLFDVEGALSAGEKATWSIPLNGESDWAAPTVLNGDLEVQVLRIDDADNVIIVDGTGLGAEDEARLNELTKKYGVS